MLEWNDVPMFLSERHVSGNDHGQQKRLQTLMTAWIVLQVAPPQVDGAHLR